MKDKDVNLKLSAQSDVLIVIPVKNEEKYIKNCLDAARNQNYNAGAISIVVVDNGSTDNTIKYVQCYSDVELLYKLDGTIGSLRNFGAFASESKYIAFLDGDTVPPVNWLFVGIDLLQQHSASCVGFAASAPDDSDTWVTKTWHAMNSGAKYKGTCRVEWLSSFNLIVDREYFKRVGSFDENLETCEDADFGKKLSKISNVVYSDKISVKHLGVVKTVKEFFLKELWRGKSNLRYYKKNISDKKSILNIFIPFLYLCSFITLLMTLIVDSFLIWFFLLIVIVMPLGFVFYKTNFSCRYSRLPMMSFLAIVYLIARGVAVLKS